MKPVSVAQVVTFLTAVFFCVIVNADTSATQAWLMKMQSANKQQNYIGTFIYRHDAHLETMRIVHRVRSGKVLERIVSLNGPAREVVRDNRIERIYLPDKNIIQINSRTKNENEFPALLTRSMENFQNHYHVMLGGESRIADRMVQMVIIKSRDEYRYGYRLWADKKTGLLLKADLVNMKGQSLEQYMFTNIRIGIAIPATMLRPRMSTRGVKIKQQNAHKIAPVTDMIWSVRNLPKGFRLSAKMLGICPAHKTPVHHLVYTDGLAAVSIFIEKAGKNRKVIKGLNQMGAIHAYGKMLNGYQITVVGQVPAGTVRQFGKSIFSSQIARLPVSVR